MLEQVLSEGNDLQCAQAFSAFSNNHSFIHSQAPIVQDGPFASLSGFLNSTHTRLQGRTPLDENI